MEQYLGGLEPLTSPYGIETGSAEVNGHNYARSVSLRVDKSSIPENYAEYNLGRHWRTFEAAIGLQDDAPSGCQIEFEVFVDGKAINDTKLSLGEMRDLKLNISNALRLKIQATYASSTDISNYCYGVWGGARLGT
ncbi:NPCBM/NEW2 domain-containing protein [Streptomyces sp. NPDC005409]|uniref:NPCBM/NEW2 domain-containing protein n=1 Tax=Streptomyces sp. NPDC005409 TaxID=3155342 RepID=UPI0034564CC1